MSDVTMDKISQALCTKAEEESRINNGLKISTSNFKANAAYLDIGLHASYMSVILLYNFISRVAAVYDYILFI